MCVSGMKMKETYCTASLLTPIISLRTDPQKKFIDPQKKFILTPSRSLLGGTKLIHLHVCLLTLIQALPTMRLADSGAVVVSGAVTDAD